MAYKLTKLDKILFVDDEIPLLNSMQRNFRNEAFSSYYATSGERALDIMEAEEIKVIVSDLQMPGMNGLELLEIVENKYPDIVKIVLTGNAQIPNILAAVNKVNIFKYMIKPWKYEEEFIPAIIEAFEIYESKKIKKEIMNKTNLVVNDQTVDPKYFYLIADMAEKVIEHTNIIQAISRKLPAMNREFLEKLSVDIYTRTGIMKEDLEAIEKMIDFIQKKKV